MAQSDLDIAAIPTPTNDDEVTERVRAKLAVVLADIPIDVKTKSGVVTLTGQIRDSAQSRAASLITHRVEGVTNVVNKLTVGRGVLSFVPRTTAPSRTRPAAPRRLRRAEPGAEDQAATPPAAS